MGAAKGNSNAKNDMTKDDAPWAEGGDAYWLDSLIYDSVAAGLTEADPTTTNWEESKTLLGSGKVASLVLASWAIAQMQAAAVTAGGSADDIGFLPVPAAAAGPTYAVILSDRAFAINKQSKNKEAARAWVDWFINSGSYAADQGFISAVKSAPLPASLAGLNTLGTKLIEVTPPAAGKEGLFDQIDSQSEIGFSAAGYRQKLVDEARAGTPKADAFAELNTKWAAARAAIG